ncbi:LacI family DNA-binding transcriptional regulator [Jannaschia sp. LMIT008]|uniref:LacI family DNA-binding transcriptional regulator n=1 Tax=Jannaschia maritima TaxID=3032585 RepID=UPI00281276A1|nr:LacI family DNA-binding transcriptional regulator [Jannaschia sp. LMIT008]
MPDADRVLPPTTKDLARAAGVSRATVDRVLNGRLGVRQATVDRVNQAIRDLGFVRNMAAANLAKGRSYRFVHLLPSSGDLFLEELERCIAEAARFSADRLVTDIRRIDANDPHAVARDLAALGAEGCDGVALMAPRSPPVRDAIARLDDAGVPVIPFVSSQGGSFVGIDDRAAGATAGLLMGRFAGAGSGSVLVLSETMTAQDSLNRRLGFDAILAARFPALRVPASLETYGDPDRTRAVLSRAVAGRPDLRGLYVLSSEARVPLDVLGGMDLPRDLVVIAHERTAATVAALLDGRVSAIITQDPGHLARSVLRRLKALSDGREVFAAQERIRTEILLETNL